MYTVKTLPEYSVDFFTRAALRIFYILASKVSMYNHPLSEIRNRIYKGKVAAKVSHLVESLLQTMRLELGLP